jgi:xanthine/CO dehydrogenase XdhC/CoxF family maturation factor
MRRRHRRRDLGIGAASRRQPVEGAVVQEALEAMQDGKPRLLEFGVSNSQAWEVGLACGGKIRIFVERVE